MKLTEACINKPVFAWMLMAATIVFGAVAVTRIGISQFPDVDYPTISVSVGYEGASPEIVENDVIEPLEEALVQVEGIKSLNSSSRLSGGNISLEFDISRDIDVALQDVQAKISQAQRALPRDVDPPIISKSNPEDQPIMWITLSGPFSKQVLSDYARYQLREKFQTVSGIGEIQVGGFSDRNVRIWLDARKMESRNLTVTDITRALQQQHVELPAGRLETDGGREVNIRVLGEAVDLATLRKIVIREIGGSPVYLEDVAIVEDGFADERNIARVDGQPTQGMGIKKQRGANAVAVAQNVRLVMTDIQKTLPQGMILGINNDSTRFIEDSVHEIEFELILAVILTGIVCWIFLGSMSSTLNVVLAIPMSLLGTIATIYFLGFTLNTFTLLALGLAVGIVVDDAIMIMENIFRHAEEGKDRVRASREGTQEIAFAAFAATIAVVAIFVPVVFMDGVIGQFFLQFGITLSVAVLLSYLEAVTLAPSRCAQLLSTSREGRNRFGLWVDSLFSRLAKRYAVFLETALRRPVSILGGAMIILAGAAYLIQKMPSEFVPSQDQSRLMVRLQTAIGSDLGETTRLFDRAEEWVKNRSEVQRTFSIVGGFGGGVNTGFMMLNLVPPDDRKLTHMAFAAEMRRSLNTIPGLRAVVQDPSQSGLIAQRGYPVEFSIRGGDWNQLIAVTEEVTDKMTASGTVVDLDTDYRVGMPELRIIPDRARAADLGIPMEDVAVALNAMVGGVRVGKYNSGGRRLDVRMRLLASQRSRPEDLAYLRVRSKTGDMVPLTSLIKYEERPTLQTISRRDRERAITVFANVAPNHSQSDAISAIETISKEMPVGTRLVLAGASQAFQDSMNSLIFAFILGILVAYMVLASQFNSLLHPITVLTILPLSVAGAVGALWLTGKSLNIFSMIGLLLLMGIVKKNSIILVDYANQLRETGLSALEAILKAGPVRLRPILMTSVATFMAALPIALGLGPGSEIRTPMAIGILGGLLVSTALSLVVVPAFYVVSDRLAARLRRTAKQTVPANEPVPLPTSALSSSTTTLSSSNE